MSCIERPCLQRQTDRNRDREGSFYFIFLTCISVLPAHVSVHYKCPQRLEEAMGFTVIGELRATVLLLKTEGQSSTRAASAPDTCPSGFKKPSLTPSPTYDIRNTVTAVCDRVLLAFNLPSPCLSPWMLGLQSCTRTLRITGGFEKAVRGKH